MRLRALSLTLAAVAALAVTGRAQDGKSFSAHAGSQSRQTADEVEDIGELDGAASGVFARSKFRVNVTTREQFTTNAKLVGNHGSNDFIFLPTIEVGYNTEIGKYFHLDIAGKIESAVYARFDERSFYGYSAVATFDYRPAPNLPRIYIGLEPYRYLSYDTGSRITQALGLNAGTDWGVSFNHGKSLAFIGYTFTDYIADPSIDNRQQHSIVVGFAHSFTERLTGQLYYSWQYDTFDIGRHDSRNIVGGSLLYQFNKHLFGSVTTSFVDSQSSENLASYQSFGASLGMSVQF